MTFYHTLTLIFNSKVMSMGTLNLASSLLKNLSHFLTSLHVSLHVIINIILDKKLKSRTVLNLVPRLFKMHSYLPKSYQVLSHLVTLYPPFLIKN